jgi:hypothetical protein
MTEEYKGADPKFLVAIQMIAIGIILFILGVTVFLLSPLGKMAPFVRLCSVLTNSGLVVTGLLFWLGGYFRLKKAKKVKK